MMNQPILPSRRGSKRYSASMWALRLTLIAAVLGLAGCNMPMSTPATATADPAIITQTVAAVQTEAVQAVYTHLTEVAALTPSVTPTLPPTATAIPTIAPLPSIPTQQSQAPAGGAANPPSGGNVPQQPAAPTKAPTAAPTITSTPSAYQCSVTSLSPSAGATYDEGEDFDLNVTLKNTGTETWSGDNMDFDYISGAEFQESADAVDLPNDVDPGESVELTVDMAASEDPGDYTAVWGLMNSGTAFCTVTLSITIED